MSEQAERAGSRRKRQVLILNLMPDVEAYHGELVNALEHAAGRIAIHWGRLETKPAVGDSQRFVDQRYCSAIAICEEVEVEAMLITGAPVELKEFEDVEYWPELSDIIATAIDKGVVTLGICWGALAVGKVLGIRKINLSQKIFGVFAAENLVDDGAPFGALARELSIPFSIRAEFSPDDIAARRTRGEIAVLAGTSLVPHALLQTADMRHLMCLGHPEYGPTRLLNEWDRDRRRQPALPPPVGIDVASPDNYWRVSSQQLFSYWIDCIEVSLRVRNRDVAPDARFTQMVGKDR